jgi:hypothetical protein
VANVAVIFSAIGHVEAVEVLQRLHHEDIGRGIELRQHERLRPLAGILPREIAASDGLPARAAAIGSCSKYPLMPVSALALTYEG